MNESRDLTRSECLDLLSLSAVARVAVGTPDGPHIVPVNYVVHEDAVIIRTSSYSLLGTYGRDAVVALEIDGFDLPTQSGWSVVLRGRSAVETDPRTIVAIRRAAPTAGPWVGGTRNLYLRLSLDQVSGRAVGDVTLAAMLESLAALHSDAGDALLRR